jgi:hypothetical protein
MRSGEQQQPAHTLDVEMSSFRRDWDVTWPPTPIVCGESHVGVPDLASELM